MRQLSTVAKQSIFAPETDVVWLILLTIDHASLTAPIRVVNNTVDIVSRGETYIACPFRLIPPQEREDAPPVVRLEIDNVDRNIVASIRGLNGSPTITMEIVTNNDLDFVEIGPMQFLLRTADFNALVVSGELAYEPVLTEPYPSGTFNPADFPGLF